MQNFWEMTVRGGWPMIAIGVCSVVGLAVVIERLMVLRRNRVIAPQVDRAATAYAGEGDAANLLLTCAQCGGAYARIVAAITQMRGLEHAQALERMRAIGRVEVERLERGVTLLEIIAAITPLLGLLGTVLGMMEVFNVITAEGLGDPQVLSGGISKALITTVAGLCVAIPALAFYSIFMRRVGALAAEMQDRATAFIVLVQQGTKHECTPPV